MPNSKRGRNAYFFFVLEQLPELRRRGLPVAGVKDAIPLCSHDWGLLAPEEKERYAEKARQWRSGSPLSNKIPLVKKGQLSSSKVGTLIQQKPTEPAGSSVPLCTENKMLPPSNVSPVWSKNHAVLGETFYFLEILCHGELPSCCSQRFLLCEIGCVKYSLQDGILEAFHRFIDPGEIPRGFRYHCQAASDATHKIPIASFELADGDYQKLFRDLCNFIRPSPGVWPPVYVKSSETFKVSWCLKWLSGKAGMANVSLKVCDLEELLVKLYKHKLDEEPSRSRVRRMLDVFVWDYASNTRCRWHEENDIVLCALAVCKKHAYCISESLAPVYGFILTSAHTPAHEENCGIIINPKMVVLDSIRYQKGRKKDSSCGGRYFSLHSSAMKATEIALRESPAGVGPGISPVGRGRGITRLLERLSASGQALSG
uniref:Protein maelstrom homolog n=1 Tax=Latimeria menadoensis TaxID=106881 RepID=A0A1W1ELN2_LATME|nr:Maelstrom Spermatogenic Transposon Silencer [Latimeria menadoensis]